MNWLNKILLTLKKKIDEITNQINEDLNNTLFELGAEPLDLTNDDEVNQRI